MTTDSSTSPDSTTADPDAAHRAGKALRSTAMVVAVVFLAVGMAGFIPGLTTNADDLELYARHDGADGAPAELLGLFHVSVLHNLVHLAFGLAGLALARTIKGARGFLIGGGIVYAVVFLYGIVVDHDSKANFLPVNDADNVLHAGLAIAMIGLGLALTPRPVPSRAAR